MLASPVPVAIYVTAPEHVRRHFPMPDPENYTKLQGQERAVEYCMDDEDSAWVLRPHLHLAAAQPVLGTLSPPNPRYFVLTPSQALRAHPIPGTSCSPYPRYYSVLTQSLVLRLPHNSYSVLTVS